MPNWAGLSKNLALWLLVALLAVFLFQVMGKPRGGTAELNYTEFTRQVEAGNIKSVEIYDGKVVKGDFRTPISEATTRCARSPRCSPVRSATRRSSGSTTPGS
jgi:ATP-dependent Zn protease